tara:strand:- start:1259 stop:1741 length:483 start_codon:yes stop_codon:yes gene_type:complete
VSEKLNFTRHLIECHCILKIFQNNTKPVYHKFPVFSVFENEKNIEKKFVSCNNCGAIHEITDLCKSEIKWGSDMFTGLVVTKEDVKFNLKNSGYENIIQVLETNECDISIWELALHCLENNIEQTIVLSKKEIQNNVIYNCLNIKEGSFKIKKEIMQRYL